MRKAKRWAWVAMTAAWVGGAFPAASHGPLALAEEGPAARVEDLVGTWLFLQDRSPASAVDTSRMRPPAGSRFVIALEDHALVLTMERRGAPHVTRYPLDGSKAVKTERGATRTSSGRFEDGVWRTSMRVEAPGRNAAKREITESTLTAAPTAEGLIVTMTITSPIHIVRSALYKRAQDVPAPTPAKADLAALAWLPGAWVRRQDGASSEERWGPPGGGALLGTARTVVGGRMVMFEFLRIVERAGGLVYIAQPGGAAPTEFVLAAITPTRAVFENPQHDYPQRIVYERDGERGLVTEISDSRGQRPHRARYTRE